MNKVCFNVLVGIPGAGKTTYCQRIQEHLNSTNSSLNAIHICFDDFIKFDATVDLENSSFKSKRKRLLEYLEQFINAIKVLDFSNFKQINNLLLQEFNNKIGLDIPKSHSNYLILIDDNMYYRSMRYHVFQIARRTTSGYFQTYFNVKLESAASRNLDRLNPVPTEVISRMFYRLEKPDEGICKWEKNTITLNASSEDVEIVLNQTLKCLENPIKPLENPVNSNESHVEQSIVHKVDLALRKIVGEIVKQQKELLSGNDIKLFADGLLCKRKLLLEDLRAGLVEINLETMYDAQLKLLLV